MFDCVLRDIQRVLRRQEGRLEQFGALFLTPGLHAVLLYRLSRWLFLHRTRILAAAVSYLNCVLTGAQISPRAAIGPGLVIYHPYGTVIGGTAVVGRNCTLVHGNVLGQLEGGGDRPVIGDDFYAGTGAKILGAIRIGNSVRIGANAVVVTSLPDGATVAPPRSGPVLDGRDKVPASSATSSSPRATTLHRLLPLVQSIVDDEGIDLRDEDATLLGEGGALDSIGVLSLIGAIEEEFNLTIDDEDVKAVHFRTVGALVSFVEKRLVP